jgi:hypothetical protein
MLSHKNDRVNLLRYETKLYQSHHFGGAGAGFGPLKSHSQK